MDGGRRKQRNRDNGNKRMRKKRTEKGSWVGDRKEEMRGKGE
jgi:hypothetical protein